MPFFRWVVLAGGVGGWPRERGVPIRNDREIGNREGRSANCSPVEYPGSNSGKSLANSGAAPGWQKAREGVGSSRLQQLKVL